MGEWIWLIAWFAFIIIATVWLAQRRARATSSTARPACPSCGYFWGGHGAGCEIEADRVHALYAAERSEAEEEIDRRHIDERDRADKWW